MSWFVFACLLAVAYSHPSTDELYRIPRNAEFSSSSSSANTGAFASAGAGAFSSAGTAVSSGPGGAGSFSAKASLINSNGFEPNFVGVSTDTYAPQFGYQPSNQIPQSSPQLPLNNVGNRFGPFAGSGGGFASAGGMPQFGNGGFSNFMPPIPDFMPNEFKAFMQQHINAMAAHSDTVRKRIQSGISGSVPSSDNTIGAVAFGQYGPNGGSGSAAVYPAPEGGLVERINSNDQRPVNGPSGPVSSVNAVFPPPQGQFQGISTFSSSGFSDVNGKKTSYKTSSVTVNDNNNVTTYTAHDP